MSNKLLDSLGRPLGTQNHGPLEDAINQIIAQSEDILHQITAAPFRVIMVAGNISNGAAVCQSSLNIDQQIRVLEDTVLQLKAKRGFAIVDPTAFRKQ